MNKAQKRTFDVIAGDSVTGPDGESTRTSQRPASRSCKGCHERKVRCDRASPCINCTRYGILCIYPTKDKDEKRKAYTLQSVCDRLERLENLLSRFVQGDTAASTDSQTDQQKLPNRISDTSNRDESSTRCAKTVIGGLAYQQGHREHASPATWQLLLEDASRIAESAKAASLADSVQLGQTIEQPRLHPSPAETHCTQPVSSTRRASGSQSKVPNILGPVASVVDRYPNAELALNLWNIYVSSVDPVLKILHVPSIQSSVISTILSPSSATPAMLALTYSTYYAAVTTLCHDKHSKAFKLQVNAVDLLRQLRASLDRLLFTTDLMSRPNMTSLQALVIYATCLRAHEFGRSVWVLNGLAIRTAQSLGLDREDASFAFSPFQTEMRLRLWWHLCILDSRAPEDHGFQPMVDISNRHLRLPLNVNDNQICPDMTHLPSESNEWTEMSFFLLQTGACRILFPVLDLEDRHHTDTLSDVSEKRKWVVERGQQLSAGHFIHSKPEAALRLSRITEQHNRTARLKMEFMLQLREEVATRNSTEEVSRTSDGRRPSFELACETLESSYRLCDYSLTVEFAWFFRMYTQWYALAHVLRYLCSCASGPNSDRAWALVDRLLPQQEGLNDLVQNDHDSHEPTSVWSSLNLLRIRATTLRDQAQSSLFETGTDERTISIEHDCEPVRIPHTNKSTQVVATPPQGDELNLGKASDEAFLIRDENQSSSQDLPLPDNLFLADSDWDAVMNGWWGDTLQ